MKKRLIIALLAYSTLCISACAADGLKKTPQTGNLGSAESGTDDTGTGETVADSGISDTNTESADASLQATDNNEAGIAKDDARVTLAIQPTNVSVSYAKHQTETTAEDGTVIFTQSYQLPSVSIEGREEAAAKINADLSTYLPSASDAPENGNIFLEEMLKEYQEMPDIFGGLPYSSAISVKTRRMDDQIVAFEMTNYEYSGGAHGNYGSVGLNYNTKTGERISFEELSDDAEAFRAAALDYLISLTKTPAYADKMFPPDASSGQTDASAVESTLFGEDHWFFSESGITFISDPYALGPYAAGTIHFTIPYDAALNMGLKTEYAYNGNYVLARYYTPSYDSETMEQNITGKAEYSFDLNGDDADEGIAFYGSVYVTDTSTDGSGNTPEGGHSEILLYIDGVDHGNALMGQIDLNAGWLDNEYVLFDLNPEDDFIEIGVPYTSQIPSDGSEDASQDYSEYTAFFRYTKEKELIYVGTVSGNAAKNADIDWDSFQG